MGLYTFLYENVLYRLFIIHIQPPLLVTARLYAIQHIQRIQPYSHTRHTSYSAIQPPSGQKPRRQPMIESARAASGASAVDRCEIITVHGPGEASDLLRGGKG